jgi:hypothetical protein
MERETEMERTLVRDRDGDGAMERALRNPPPKKNTPLPASACGEMPCSSQHIPTYAKGGVAVCARAQRPPPLTPRNPQPPRTPIRTLLSGRGTHIHGDGGETQQEARDPLVLRARLSPSLPPSRSLALSLSLARPVSLSRSPCLSLSLARSLCLNLCLFRCLSPNGAFGGTSEEGGREEGTGVDRSDQGDGKGYSAYRLPSPYAPGFSSPIPLPFFALTTITLPATQSTPPPPFPLLPSPFSLPPSPPPLLPPPTLLGAHLREAGAAKGGVEPRHLDQQHLSPPPIRQARTCTHRAIIHAESHA